MSLTSLQREDKSAGHNSNSCTQLSHYGSVETEFLVSLDNEYSSVGKSELNRDISG